MERVARVGVRGVGVGIPCGERGGGVVDGMGDDCSGLVVGPVRRIRGVDGWVQVGGRKVKKDWGSRIRGSG